MYSRFKTLPLRHFKKMALLEAEECWATSTGMAALFTIFMSFLKVETELSRKAFLEAVIMW